MSIGDSPAVFDWQDDGSDRHDLVAYGLDTIADIALNGRPVASTRNFHRSYRWDVRGLLRDGANELTVTFTSPVRESDHMEQARGYYPHTEHHAFNQIRKPSYSFGWDWGIDVANAGIWREIGIDSWSGVRIASVRPLVDVTADGTGLLNVHVEIERAGKGRVMSPYDSHPVRQAVPVHAEISGFGTNLVRRWRRGRRPQRGRADDRRAGSEAVVARRLRRPTVVRCRRHCR